MFKCRAQREVVSPSQQDSVESSEFSLSEQVELGFVLASNLIYFKSKIGKTSYAANCGHTFG